MGHCDREGWVHKEGSPKGKSRRAFKVCSRPGGGWVTLLICSRCPGYLIREGWFCRKLQGQGRGPVRIPLVSSRMPAVSCFWYGESCGQRLVPSLFQHRWWLRSMSQHISNIRQQILLKQQLYPVEKPLQLQKLQFQHRYQSQNLGRS